VPGNSSADPRAPLTPRRIHGLVLGWFGPSKAEKAAAAAKKLWKAAKDGDEAELRRLIGLGKSVNWHNPEYYEFTALMKASAGGHEGCVRLLIDSRAIINDKDVSLECPLPSTRHGAASM